MPPILALLLVATGRLVADSDVLVLQNDHLLQELRLRDGRWQTVRFARADGTDSLAVDSDEFEILLFDGRRFTIDDYELSGRANLSRDGGRQLLRIDYKRKPATGSEAPQAVAIEYVLGEGPFVRKTVFLTVRQRDRVDRLQVVRFSTPAKASRGGLGQPVLIGNWFFGVDYPGFYSRHSDGFQQPDFNYRIPYTIDLEGCDKEFAPRDGLVTLFHFPDATRTSPDGGWQIVSKTAVVGISRTKGDGAELALLDYIAETRRKPRSHLHYNNWYSPEAKTLTVENFVGKIHDPIRENLARHGVVLDAMVPDHGWQNGKTYRRIYEPKLDESHVPLPQLSKALARQGTGLGIWIALDGTNNSVPRGLELGYRSAYKPGFERSARWLQGKEYFDILDPKYIADLKESLRHLIVDAHVEYIKHDFNHNFTSHGHTQRHARERCLDVTLELLAYERSLNPNVYQNYTNGTWFSPWWLQQVDTVWMMSGDSGGGGNWPQLSLRDGATTYRDSHFFQSFNNPARCPRPVIPIANFMTHGILFSRKKPFTDFKDTLHDWSNYVVMYFARGTLVKELYLTPELLDDDHWNVLGKAARWAVENQHRLINTVLIGGDPGAGQVYGYVSWVDGRAILSVRNPDRRRQTLRVPLDRSVYYRGEPGRPFHARAVYPFVEQMPWKLTSGRTFPLQVPGDSVVVYELEPGPPLSTAVSQAAPLPEFQAALHDDSFELTLHVPDEQLPRYDLLVEPWTIADCTLVINGAVVRPSRSAKGKRWSLDAYDLRPYRGKTLKIRGQLTAPADAERLRADRKADVEIWLVADREVATQPAPQDEALPLPISQNYRRVIQAVLPRTAIRLGIAP